MKKNKGKVWGGAVGSVVGATVGMVSVPVVVAKAAAKGTAGGAAIVSGITKLGGGALLRGVIVTAGIPALVLVASFAAGVGIGAIIEHCNDPATKQKHRRR